VADRHRDTVPDRRVTRRTCSWTDVHRGPAS
jgi:hypothetical protein